MVPGDTDCLFDRIVAGSVPAHLVLDETDVVAFLDHRPVFPGHVLVVPRAHHRSLAEVPEEALGGLFGAARRVAAAQRAALGNPGTWIALNDVVSQSVPHVHLHVVPRRPRDGLRGFFWPRGRYATDAEAASVAESIRAGLDRGPTASR